MDDDRIMIRPILDEGLVPVTPEEEVRWLLARGQIMTLTRDGVRYRVLEPGERGEPDA